MKFTIKEVKALITQSLIVCLVISLLGSGFSHNVSAAATTKVQEYYYYSKYNVQVDPPNTKGSLVEQNIKAADNAYPDNGIHTDGYWYIKTGLVQNIIPTIYIFTSGNKSINLKHESKTFVMSGQVNDSDDDTILVSAIVGGVQKNIQVENTSTPKDWSLTWYASELPTGTFNNITVTADDGFGGTDSSTYAGKLIVDKTPLFYWDKYTSFMGWAEHTYGNATGTEVSNGPKKYWTSYTVADDPYPEGSLTTSGSVEYVEQLGQKGYLSYSSSQGTGSNKYGVSQYTLTNISGNIYTYNIVDIALQLTPMRGSYLQLNLLEPDGTYPDNGKHTDGYWYVKKATNNLSPVLTVNSEEKLLDRRTMFTISGTLLDNNNDIVTVSATIGGVTKQTTTLGNSQPKQWALTWTTDEIVEGRYSNFRVVAEDGKGGVESVEYTNQIIFDKTPPTAPVVKLSSKEWSKDPVEVEITPGTDNVSGVKITEYKIGLEPWKEYSVPIRVSTDGEIQIKARSKDKLGNISTETAATAKVDLSPPTAPIIQVNPRWTKEAIVEITPGTDLGSGVKRTEYRIGSGEWKEYTDSIKISEEGTTEVWTRTTDQVGNVSAEIKAEAKVDKTVPTITFSPSERPWSAEDIHLKINYADTLSGLDLNKTFYKITNTKTEPSNWETALPEQDLIINDEGQWYVHAKTMDEAGNVYQTVTEVLQLQEKPEVPNLTVTDTQENSVTLEWALTAKYSDGYRYVVENKTTDKKYEYQHPVNFYKENDLAAGTQYEYQIKALNHVGESESSSTVSALTLPAAPASFEIKNEGRDFGTVHVNIDPVQSANSYRVVVKEGSTSKEVGNQVVQDPTAEIQGLQPGTTYSFIVTAINSTGEGKSTVKSFLTLPDTPGNFSSILIQKDFIELGWNSVASANLYSLERKWLETEKNNVPVSPIQPLSIEPPPATPEQEPDVPSTDSGQPGKEVTAQPDPEQAENHAQTSSNDSKEPEKEDPKESQNEQQPVITRKEEILIDPDYKLLYQGPDQWFKETGLLFGTSYDFRVFAANESGEGEYAQLLDIQTLPDGVKNFKVVETTTESLALSWDPVTGADEYIIRVTGVPQIRVPEGTNYTLDNLEAGTRYEISIVAQNQSGEGQSESISAITIPGAPSQINVTNIEENKATINIDPVIGATKYRVKIGEQEYEMTDTSIDVTVSEGGVTYPFTVEAGNAAGYSPIARGSFLTLPPSPNGIKTTQLSDSSFTISWDPVKSAEKYIITNEQGDTIAQVDEPIYEMTQPAPGKTGLVFVAAQNATGLGVKAKYTQQTLPYSGVKTPIDLKEPGLHEIELSWEPVPGAEGYKIVDGQGNLLLDTQNPSGKVEGLGSSTKYEDWKVIPYNPAGDAKQGIAVPKFETLPSDQYEVNVTGTKPGELTFSISGDLKEETYVIVYKDKEIFRGKDNTYTLTGLPENASFTFKIHTENSAGLKSKEKTFTGKTQYVPPVIVPSSPSTPPVVDGGPKKPEVPVTKPEEEKPSLPLPVFNDIGKTFAQKEINSLYEQGIVKGISATEFAPERSISRIEFASIIVRALGYGTADPSKVSFTDVKADAWYMPELAAAIENQVAKGFSKTEFRPNQLITREEASKMLSNVLFKNGFLPEGTISFTDGKEISAWAKDDVKALAMTELLKGYEDGTFRPQQNLTRAESAALIYRTIQKGIK